MDGSTATLGATGINLIFGEAFHAEQVCGPSP